MTPEELDAVNWAFQYFYHMDITNACIHCAPVRFSPITFRLAEIAPPSIDTALVIAAAGTYQLDMGR